MRAFMVVVAAGLLVGCATQGMEVARVTEIRPTGKASGLDVYSERRRGGEKVPDFAGDQIVDVRTYTAQEEGDFAGPEFAGAVCSVKARDFEAQVTTPARIRVPLYRWQSSPLSVSCTRDGYQTRSIVVEVYNKTKNDRYAAASGGGGLAGLLVVAAINELSDEKTHEFAYPAARVIMRPAAKGAVRSAKVDRP